MNVNITSDGLWKNTHIIINGQELHVEKMTIEGDNRRYGDFLHLTLEVFMPNLDIEVLEKNTELTITKE